MKKTISIILGLILLMNVSAMLGSCTGDGEKTIKVYGTIELDGDPVEDADILVKNLDKEYEASTTTDGDGYYEVYINGKNHDDIEVNVDFDDLDDDRQFEIVDGKHNYENNFEFESSPVRKTYHNIANLVFGFHWGIWEWLIFIFVILLILCMVKKVFFNNNHHDQHDHHDDYYYRRRKYK